jgi:hypothetical protein
MRYGIIYGYNITLLDKVQTVMKGGHAKHTCYSYKCNDVKEHCNAGEPKCDELFRRGLEICNSADPDALQTYLEEEKAKVFETSLSERGKKLITKYESNLISTRLNHKNGQFLLRVYRKKLRTFR